MVHEAAWSAFDDDKPGAVERTARGAGVGALVGGAGGGALGLAGSALALSPKHKANTLARVGLPAGSSRKKLLGAALGGAAIYSGIGAAMGSVPGAAAGYFSD